MVAKSCKCLEVIAAVVVAAACTGAAYAEVAVIKNSPVAVDSGRRVQQQLAQLCSIYVRDARAVQAGLEARDVIAELRSLREAGQDVLGQAVIFTGRIQVTRGNVRRARAAHRVWRAVLELVYGGAEGIDGAALSAAVEPFVNTTDAHERGAMLDVLKLLAHSGGRCDMAPLRPIVLQQREAPPNALVEFMYRTAPGQALRMMAGAYDPRAMHNLEPMLRNVEDDARRASSTAATVQADVASANTALNVLSELAGDSRWWVRLYAKSVLTTRPRHRGAATARLVASGLDEDPNPLVRDSFRTAR